MTCRVCLSKLLPDGACRYKCDPALAAPSRRESASRARARARKSAESQVAISDLKPRLNAVLHRVDPSYRAERAQYERQQRRRKTPG